MNFRFLFAYAMTVATMTALYHYSDRETWNHVYVIVPFFIIFWVFSLLNRQNERFKGNAKVVDLNHYRKLKKSHKKKETQTPPPEKWITIYSSCDKSKIELIQSLLSSNMIDCQVSNRHTASILPSIEGINLEIKVKVEDMDKAMDLLKQHQLIN